MSKKRGSFRLGGCDLDLFHAPGRLREIVPAVGEESDLPERLIHCMDCRSLIGSNDRSDAAVQRFFKKPLPFQVVENG